MKIEELQPGSPVIIHHGYGRARKTDRVERVTNTQIILAGTKSMRFRRKDGYAVGGDLYHRWHIKPATPELLIEVARETMLHDLFNLNREHVKTLPNETIYEAHKLLCNHK